MRNIIVALAFIVISSLEAVSANFYRVLQSITVTPFR